MLSQFCYLMHKYNLVLHGKKNKLKILHLITYYKYCTGKRKKEARIHVYKLCCEHRRLLCFKNTVDRGLTLQDKKSSGLVQEKGVVKAMNP
nr:hypothetical protein Itr_chr12CG28490 [Ipomoea trifida]GMD69414.1 hypothetical protein Iba_chr12dCG18750 [Ipomoea batatas]